MALLSDRNPIERDNAIQFLAEPHLYLYNNIAVRKSVTGLLKRYFPVFDAEAVVDQYFKKWKKDKKNKYWPLIHYLYHVQLRDDEYCKSAIRELWNVNGKLASGEGTRMHADFEAIVNGLSPPQGETIEVKLFRRWLASFCTQFELEPLRSELTVYYLHDNKVLVAGQVDLILKSKKDDSFWCVDYKRTDPTPRMGKELELLGDTKPQNSKFAQFGSGPFIDLYDDDYIKYSVQQNIYAHICATQYNMDFRDNMFLLQVHPMLTEAHTVTVERMDDKMEALFALEQGLMAAEEDGNAF